MGDRRLEREIGEELRYHVEGRASELEAEGWSPEEARREAERRFGDRARIARACAWEYDVVDRRERRTEVMRTIVQDVRYGLRMLRRNPGFALVALLTLTLGIGATTAIFSVVDGVVFRPLPFPESDRLVLIFETNSSKGLDLDEPSPPNFLDWRAAEPASFRSLAAWSDNSATLTDVDRPEVVALAMVTSNLFDVLGLRLAEGRGFMEGEDERSAVRVAVVSDGAWRRIWGAAPDLVGRTIRLDGVATQVVGITPPGFAVPRADIDVWIPIGFEGEHRQSRYLGVLGRLSPRVTPAQANAEMDGIAARLAEQYPEENGGWRTRVIPAHDQLVGDVRPMLLLVFTAVGFVLLIACVNVANLLAGRSAAREGELAVRAALGAGTGRLRAQLMTESVILGLLGGALGILLAHRGVRLFLSIEPGILPREAEVAVDGRVLAFTLGISVLAGLLFGMAPGLRFSRASLLSTLGDAGRRSVGARSGSLTRRSLIVTEVALALVLLVGAGLAVRSLLALRAVKTGYDTEGIIAARVNVEGERYASSAARLTYFDELTRRLAELPGVAHVGVTSTLPLTPAGIDFNLPYVAEGDPMVGEQEAEEVDYRIASPGYFRAMGIPLVKGRGFDDRDRADGKRVLLVNETFAKLHWPGEEPVGRTVRVFYVQDTDWEVAGVVGDTRHAGLSVPVQAQIFVPLAQAEYLFGFMTIVVRRAGAAPGLEDRIRDVGLALDAQEPLYSLETMESLVARATAPDRMAAFVFALFAVLALALSVAGIYGVISYQVTRRTREIGVRMALGAAPASVVATVVGEAALLAALGITIGAAGAFAGTRMARNHLFGVSATDPLTFFGVSMLLFLIAILAALVPAARAARIPPVTALRAD
jgi:putative ABC transport system permease protein